MESKRGATRVYQDFEPSMEWVPEDDSDTLLVYLPGFAKEQLRVQLKARNLIISGERKLHENTWSRFRVEFPVSGNCDLNKITAKYEVNILFVRQPKIITSTPKPEELAKAVDESNTLMQSNIDKKELGKDVDDPKKGVEEVERKACIVGVCENESKKKTSESGKKAVYRETDKTVLEKYKGTARAFAIKLKSSSNTIVVLVVGLVIGIYVSNSINSWTNA